MEQFFGVKNGSLVGKIDARVLAEKQTVQTHLLSGRYASTADRDLSPSLLLLLLTTMVMAQLG